MRRPRPGSLGPSPVAGGRLPRQLLAIREAADRFGGEIYLTSRQGVEIPNVPQDALAPLQEFSRPPASGRASAAPRFARDRVPGVPRLPERGDRFPGAGGCGRQGTLRKVRTAQVQDRHLGVRQQLHEGRRERRGDQGVDRAVLGGAGLHLLPGLPGRLPDEGDRRSADGNTLIVDPELCIGCGDCITSCPTGSMWEKPRVPDFAGGKFGRRRPSGEIGSCGILRTKEEAMAAIEAVLDSSAHGKSRERFGDTLQRMGFPAMETFVRRRRGSRDDPSPDMFGNVVPDDAAKVTP